MRHRLLLAVLLLAPPPSAAQAQVAVRAGLESDDGLSGATVLIVRHAEKPIAGAGLTSRGTARALAYAGYFQALRIDDRPVRIDTLVAAADSVHSERPRLTLTPLSGTLGIPIQQPCTSWNVAGLAQWIRNGPPGRTILVAWHHGDVARLIAALGQDPRSVLRWKRWPGSVYNRVVVLHFDAAGNVIPSQNEVVKEAIKLRA